MTRQDQPFASAASMNSPQWRGRRLDDMPWTVPWCPGRHARLAAQVARRRTVAWVTAALAQIQSRISQIQSRFASLGAGGAAGTLGAASIGSGSVSSASFQSALAAAGMTGTPGEIAPSGVDIAQFSRDVLGAIGAPTSEQNMAVMSAWVKAEGTKARYNPLATTRNAPGATQFNSVGVKNFATYQEGVATTVGAITNGLYGNVIAALRRGDDAYAVADAIEKSPWGSGALVRSVLESRNVPRPGAPAGA